jgi:transposase InsO family protein
MDLNKQTKQTNDNSKPLGKMITEKDTPKRPWQHVAMDFMSMPAKEKGKQLLVIVDRFSKMTILAITPINATAEEIYQIVWEKVFSVFGIPESIISDLDKIFRSQRWRELMSQLGVEHKLSTAHHQRTDGQSERKIQEAQVFTLRNTRIGRNGFHFFSMLLTMQSVPRRKKHLFF